MPSSVKVVTTKLPTYLKTLLQEDYSVKLVFREKPVEGVPFNIENKDEVQLSDEISELELTGNPLETDLGGDDIICSDVIMEKPPHWTSVEAQQYPLELGEARSYINSQLNLSKVNESIYCICDGSDSQHTVGLGTTVTLNKLTRFLVYVLPCEISEEINFGLLKKEHIKNVQRDAKVEILTSKKYNLYGYDLKNYNSLQTLEYYGNIGVEEFFSNQTSKSFETNSNFTMNLQVILGHPNSPLITFWEELSVIQSYIKILETSKPCNDNTVINLENCLDLYEITSIIGGFVNIVTSSKKIHQNTNTLDLTCLRQLNILDKLWSTFKHCKTLGDLRDCFHFFFEELAAKETKIQLAGEDTSAVGEIVNGILAGRIAVPTLSFSQCLELLIELGLEKLKNDYVVIITTFNPIANSTILKTWNELNSDSSAINSNKKLQRRTRISINPKVAITDLTSLKLKVTYLDSMHKVTEFLFLYKENLQMLEECFNYFCEALCNEFVVKFKKVVCFCEFKPQLCEFSFEISSAGAKTLIRNLSPVAFSVTLKSVVHYDEVTTVFYFSEYPIFPPSVYEDYDINFESKDVKNFYVAKLVKYVHSV